MVEVMLNEVLLHSEEEEVEQPVSAPKTGRKRASLFQTKKLKRKLKLAFRTENCGLMLRGLVEGSSLIGDNWTKPLTKAIDVEILQHPIFRWAVLSDVLANYSAEIKKKEEKMRDKKKSETESDEEDEEDSQEDEVGHTANSRASLLVLFSLASLSFAVVPA